eukprot:1081228-Rhodomonas_salina.1
MCIRDSPPALPSQVLSKTQETQVKHPRLLCDALYWPRLCCYARAMRYLVLTQAIAYDVRYRLSAYSSTGLRYKPLATRCPVLT